MRERVIHQAMLQQLKDLRHEQRRNQARDYELRQAILELDGQGARLEEGRLRYFIKCPPRQFIAHSAVRQILGERHLQRLLQAIPATYGPRLYVGYARKHSDDQR